MIIKKIAGTHEGRWNEFGEDTRIKVRPLFPKDMKRLGIKLDMQGNLQGTLTRSALSEIVEEWENVIDGNGKPLPCTPDNVKMACDTVYKFEDLIVIWAVGYANEIIEKKDTETKNLLPPSGGCVNTRKSEVVMSAGSQTSQRAD